MKRWACQRTLMDNQESACIQCYFLGMHPTESAFRHPLLPPCHCGPLSVSSLFHPVLRPLLAAACLCALLGGCASTSGTHGAPPPATEACGRPGMRHLPLPAVTLSEADRQRSPLSQRSTRTAETTGVLPLVLKWQTLPGAGTATALQRLSLRQQIMDRITLTGFEVASVMAELNCEDERNDQLRDRLLSQENNRLRKLTVAGMVIGAATAISTGALSLANQANAANIVSMLGGVSEVGVGIAALDDDNKGELRHRRNILANVWHEKTDQDIFPPVVWNYLTTRPDSSHPTVRENLIALWRGSGRLGEPGSQEEQRRSALLFGAGGDYNAAELKTRETLLDLLEAHVSLLNQDVAELTTELLMLMENPAAGRP